MIERSILPARAVLSVVLLILGCGSMLAQTQAEMTAQACDAYTEVDEQLNSVYKQILREYQSDRNFTEKLKKAQRAWIAYRDAHLDAIYPAGPSEYGSAHRMCRCMVLTEMTARRVEELRQWIDGLEEGDLCIGSRAMRE
jgi:uncharacterized protein YecT (DUF1311 family)